MKTKVLLLAVPCLFLGACTGSSDKEAAKQKADSLAAVAQRDSLLDAAKIMHMKDSIDASKADTGQKKDAGTKGNVD